MNEIKQKKCKVCAVKFTPYKSTQVVCTAKCAIELAFSKPVKPNYAKIKREKLEVLESISKVRKDLEREINAIIRIIDNGHKCISCNKFYNKPFAGHYHSVGSKPNLRYNLFNIYIQCFSCNGFKGGLLLEYGEGLINTFGLKHKEFCEYELVSNNYVLKLTINELKELIVIAKSIVKVLKIENKQYSNLERLQIRKKFNNMLGIYK